MSIYFYQKTSNRIVIYSRTTYIKKNYREIIYWNSRFIQLLNKKYLQFLIAWNRYTSLAVKQVTKHIDVGISQILFNCKLTSRNFNKQSPSVLPKLSSVLLTRISQPSSSWKRSLSKKIQMVLPYNLLSPLNFLNFPITQYLQHISLSNWYRYYRFQQQREKDLSVLILTLERYLPEG